MENPLLELQKLGQSPWHDNIRRSLIASGALKKMVRAGDITGLTSNPTIFEQAIAQSTDYEDSLRHLALKGKSAEQIFDALAIDDIRHAADLFLPVFKRTGGYDGYVSPTTSKHSSALILSIPCPRQPSPHTKITVALKCA